MQDAIIGLDVFGTQFNDNILADSGSFKGRLSGDDTFFSGGTKTTTPGYDYFDGGAGDDVLVLEGMPTRYDVTYAEDTSEFTFVDKLPQNVGGQGTIKIKNIEAVDYFGPDGPFILDNNWCG